MEIYTEDELKSLELADSLFTEVIKDSSEDNQNKLTAASSLVRSVNSRASLRLKNTEVESGKLTQLEIANLTEAVRNRNGKDGAYIPTALQPTNTDLPQIDTVAGQTEIEVIDLTPEDVGIDDD